MNQSHCAVPCCTILRSNLLNSISMHQICRVVLHSTQVVCTLRFSDLPLGWSHHMCYVIDTRTRLHHTQTLDPQPDEDKASSEGL
jgi:hypothetical protein